MGPAPPAIRRWAWLPGFGSPNYPLCTGNSTQYPAFRYPLGGPAHLSREKRTGFGGLQSHLWGIVRAPGPQASSQLALPQSTVNQPQPSVPVTRHLWALLVVAMLVGLDLWSKSQVMPWLEVRMTEFQSFREGPLPEPMLQRDAHGHERHPVAGNWLAWMHNLNYGAAFGRGGGIQKILVPGRILAILVLFVLVFRAPPKRKIYFGALVLVLSGALGNLYDNLFYKPLIPNPDKPFGPVRDFIDVYFEVWDWHFATFNVADACISVGVVLLLLSTILAPHPDKPHSSKDEAATQKPEHAGEGSA